ncbi:hypothetical protein GCM10010917_36560 [Paenibacillus physcomitrellae]|uniref:Uncharacterized protein n=1 Tax=Paenibacillus physcomitrellae TaxID=1619311 RepID=A0ABQ1GPP5_9BACL|nr:hypothetical protein GCM10010917_36560 [Paenibacillus physcomitrellae]
MDGCFTIGTFLWNADLAERFEENFTLIQLRPQQNRSTLRKVKLVAGATN